MSTAKKRVALLLRGAISKHHGLFEPGERLIQPNKDAYVNFEATKKSIQKYIIDANKDTCDFDIFIHSWNPDLEQELRALYNPFAAMFEDNEKYASMCQHYAPGSGNEPSQSLTIKKGIELILKSKIQYDYVIIFRPDLLIWKPMILSEYDVRNNLYVDGHYDGNGEFHFVMSLENANEFRYLYESGFHGNTPTMHLWIQRYVNAYMKKPLLKDSIIPHLHLCNTRKLYEYCYIPGHISDAVLAEFGLDVATISKYTFK